MQFVYVDTFYMSYAVDPRFETLCKLVSYLYSPKTGFNKITADANIDKIRKLTRGNLLKLRACQEMDHGTLPPRFPETI